MAGIGIAVADRGLAGLVLFEHLRHRLGDHHRAKREIAVGDGLGGAQEIRLHAPKARAGPCAGAAKGGDHLVGDQQNTIAAADRLDTRHEAGMRRDHAARAENWLHDKGVIAG